MKKCTPGTLNLQYVELPQRGFTNGSSCTAYLPAVGEGSESSLHPN